MKEKITEKQQFYLKYFWDDIMNETIANVLKVAIT